MQNINNKNTLKENNALIRTNFLESFESVYLSFEDRNLYDCLKNDLKLNDAQINLSVIYINNVSVPVDMYRRVYPKQHAKVIVQVRVAGGGFGDILKTAALIAINFAAPGLGGSLGFGAFGSGVFAAGLVAVSSLALNALIPPTDPSLGDTAEIGGSAYGQTNVITGQSNSIRRWGQCTRTYGTNRIYPNVAGLPYFATDGDQFFFCVYDLGIGRYDVENIRIGESDLENFTDFETNIVYTNSSADFTLYSEQAITQTLVNQSTGTAGTTVTQTFPVESSKVKLLFETTGLNVYQVLKLEFKKNTDTNYQLLPSSYITAVGGDGTLQRGALSRTGMENLGISYLFDTDTLEQISGAPAGFKRISSNRIKLIPNRLSTTYLKPDSTFIGAVVYFSNNQNQLGATQDTATITAIDGDFVILNKKPDCEGIQTGFECDVWPSKAYGFKGSGDYSVSIDFNLPSVDIHQVRVTTLAFATTGSVSGQALIFKSFDVVGEDTQSSINTKVNHTFLEFKIKTTGQISGQIDNINCITKSILPYYDGVDWSNEQVTSNPAWIYADILSGELNQRAIEKERLDTNSLLDWAAFCDEERQALSATGQLVTYKHELNFSIDSGETVRSIINKVCNSARASLKVFNSKYGVLIDRPQNIPVQIFSDRNATGFQSSLKYFAETEGFKVDFINKDNDYQVDSAIVLKDDSNPIVNQSILESIEAFGQTDVNQVFAYGRYMLAQAVLRRLTISINVDIENLACTRGDLVELQTQSIIEGGFPARIKSISGNNVILDSVIFATPTILRVRKNTGQIFNLDIISIVSSDEIEVSDSTNLESGDLCVLGESETVVQKYIVKNVTPGQNLTASIDLLEYSDDVYTAETETIGSYVPNERDSSLTPQTPPDPIIPVLTWDKDQRNCNLDNSNYVFFANLTWNYTGAILPVRYEIWSAEKGQVLELFDTTENQFYDRELNNLNLGKIFEFVVVAVSSTGAKRNPQLEPRQEIDLVLNELPYLQVENFRGDITNTRRVFNASWDQLNDCGLKKYVLKYNPDFFVNVIDNFVDFAEVGRETNSFLTRAEDGIYSLQAVNFVDEFGEARFIASNIPSGSERIYGASIENLPDWSGPINNNVELWNNEYLVLEQQNPTKYKNSGSYELDTIAINQIASNVIVQIEEEITGICIPDIMSNWPTLDLLPSLKSPSAGLYGVEYEVSISQDGISFGSWQTVENLDTLFGKEFKFRVNLESVPPDRECSAKIKKLKFSVGTVTRDIFENDIEVVGSRDIVINPAYITIPDVFVTIQDFEFGDKFEILNVTPSSFTIVLTDINDDPITRVIDYLVRGQGVN